ncbi:helix-turn-helix transcriptional regulator [Pseudaeromonas pectinilytica]
MLPLPAAFTDEDRHLIANFVPLVDGLASLLGTGCEVVLHAFDQLDASVIKIANGHITGREAGAPATDFALAQLRQTTVHPQEQGPQEQGPQDQVSWRSYFSRNRQGQLLKSASMTIRNRQQQPIGMLCVNFSLDAPLSSLLAALSMPVMANSLNTVPVVLENESFANSVDDLVAQVMAKVDADTRLPASARNKAIITTLYDRGLFEIKEAAHRVAERLAISRHTVYLHIRNHKAAQTADSQEKSLS